MVDLRDTDFVVEQAKHISAKNGKVAFHGACESAVRTFIQGVLLHEEVRTGCCPVVNEIRACAASQVRNTTSGSEALVLITDLVAYRFEGWRTMSSHLRMWRNAKLASDRKIAPTAQNAYASDARGNVVASAVGPSDIGSDCPSLPAFGPAPVTRSRRADGDAAISCIISSLAEPSDETNMATVLEATKLFARVAQAGFVHADPSWQNIMRFQRELCLVDWGSAFQLVDAPRNSTPTNPSTRSAAYDAMFLLFLYRNPGTLYKLQASSNYSPDLVFGEERLLRARQLLQAHLPRAIFTDTCRSTVLADVNWNVRDQSLPERYKTHCGEVSESDADDAEEELSGW